VSDTRFHPITLRFPDRALEAEFRLAHIRRYLPHTRAALLLALGLYAVFGALDPYVVPNATAFAWFARYAVVCPLILLAFVLSFRPWFEPWINRAWVSLGLMVGTSIVFFMWKDGSPSSHLYYAGLMLTFVYIYAFVRLPFVAASVTSWSIALLYQWMALSTGIAPPAVLVSNTIFLLSINIIGMSVCYSMEHAARTDFLRQRLIGRQAEDLRQALAQVEEKNAELDSFVYSVSHDLKAPLVTIQGLAGMLLEDCGARLDHHGRYLLQRITASTEHMESLIGDLLALSRIGREAQPPGPVDVGGIVREIVEDVAPAVRERVAVRIDPLPEVWAIPTHVEQVFANLVSNAVKYLGDRPDPAIEIGAVDHPAAVEFYVRDTGIGIDPKYHAKVFEIFQRLCETEAEGTGVGLAIVKKIVDAYGGRIWIESESGCGATFRFTWPRTGAERARPP
jgi:signal transduction histidine kinase